MAPRINVVCRNYKEDRIIPRMARALAERLGWTLSAAPDPTADAIYLSGYFEAQKLRPWPAIPVAAYFTHKEEEPPGNAKAKLYDKVAQQVQLRIVTAQMYAGPLSAYGLTVQCRPPLERERFTIAKPPGRKLPVVGLSGYTYANHRKGEDLVRGMLASKIGRRVEWRASGRGWPVPTKGYSWAEMPSYYQGLDVLVCPSRVEGVPMPPLEALSCGVRVVVPCGVGLLDELPDFPGIYRYARGDLQSLLVALEAAAYPSQPVSRTALREATAPYSVNAWAVDHGVAFSALLGSIDGGIAAVETAPIEAPVVEMSEPVAHETGKSRGIYCVAFGDQARTCALRLMESAKKHMPDIPIALCAAKAIGPEDILITQPDSDIGGRRAKLSAYELTPAEWQAVLYLDADTEIVAPVYQFFQWIEDGWEFAICKDVTDTLRDMRRRNSKAEVAATMAVLPTLEVLQYNGGVWSFGRSASVKAFFGRWRAEWEKFGQKDQGALVRALHAVPLRTLVLGNEWNTFPRYMPRSITAGVLHYPGEARRWKGLIPARIDSPAAWAAVKRYEAEKRREGAVRRRGR